MHSEGGIGASWKSDSVWITTKEDFYDGGYAIAKFDSDYSKWVIDLSQERGARWDLAVDHDGNPAIVSNDEKIHWK